eukprot:6199907-Pleurochrysis_carterae.AAC.1
MRLHLEEAEALRSRLSSHISPRLVANDLRMFDDSRKERALAPACAVTFACALLSFLLGTRL